MAAVLLVVAFASTFLIDLTPGDPAYAVLGDQATSAQVQELHRQLHLDDPLYARFARSLAHLVQGDLGQSYVTKQSVNSILADHLPTTAELVLLSLLAALVVSIPIGIYTAYRSDRLLDRVWTVLSSILISSPAFVTALVLVYLFSIQANGTAIGFPATGWVPLSDDVLSNLSHVTLPVVTLALYLIPQFSRLLRADMIATLKEDYILAARARGLPVRRILVGHALRPSSFSVVTLAGLSLGGLLGGAVIVEVLFSLPGIGSALYNAILTKDLPVVQGLVMFIGFVYVVGNALVDLLYYYLDPRSSSGDAK